MTGAAPDRRQDERDCCSRCGLAPEVHDDTLCAAVAAGAAPRPSWFPAVSPPPGQQREAVARWLYELYHRYADELLALLAATQDGVQP